MTGKIPKNHDPVCGMEITVGNSQYSSTYRGLVFYFCSGQCLERFSENPGLYAGSQHMDDTRSITKTHKLRFLCPDAETLRKTCDKLLLMMGVTVARPGDAHLQIEYDLRQTSLEQIEAVAENAGLILKGGLHGLRRTWWRYVEHNELDNIADSGNAACCNRPPTQLR